MTEPATFDGPLLLHRILGLEGQMDLLLFAGSSKKVCKVMPVHVVPDDLISRFTMLKEPLSIEFGPVA